MTINTENIVAWYVDHASQGARERLANALGQLPDAGGHVEGIDVRDAITAAVAVGEQRASARHVAQLDFEVAHSIAYDHRRDVLNTDATRVMTMQARVDYHFARGVKMTNPTAVAAMASRIVQLLEGGE